MRHYKIHTKLVVAAFAASAAIASSSSAQVFHGVRAHDNGVVLWEHDANNFGVSAGGQPKPGLSFYDSMEAVDIELRGQPDCYIRVMLPNPRQNDLSVGQNVNIQLQITHGGVRQNFNANFPWQIINDNIPPGHWSILGATILANILPNFDYSNNLASKVAAEGFRYLAQNDPQVTVIPGTNPNCAAQ
ncbi:hypothetical protein SAMN04488040_2910 [Sulfitobacter marinus]|uniref:Uncharacterized protein n=1 Tax=Sulfitobacter marinus TaxID=394264 RepID=A0A1I6UWJ7_9RHOB|nr:hypothetical protein [Sulfitobacter marinus]SFT05830.1 hypothetical protein SAMN04488040_2910 [Sulfitobacter marinus]